MIARNWIGGSAALDVLERRVCDFLGVSDLDQPLTLAANLAVRPRANPRLLPRSPGSSVSSDLAGLQHIPSYEPDRLTPRCPIFGPWPSARQMSPPCRHF